MYFLDKILFGKNNERFLEKTAKDFLEKQRKIFWENSERFFGKTAKDLFGKNNESYFIIVFVSVFCYNILTVVGA